ncbi:SHD1 domain-containing protein [Prosthecobacter sp.]|uniref:SHD1 domain-containing protein n=1 Tax=Prosthecobacter sp. TaxID=1965333 RepID=UPI003784518C
MKTLPNLGATFVLMSALLQAQTAAPAMHTWTSTDGRKIEAAFVAMEGEGVKIRMANGSTFTVPLNRLSAEDQTFAKNQGAAGAGTTAGAAERGAPAASKTWPRSVALEEKPVVTVVKEDAEAKEFVYRSPHYEFQCDSKLGTNVVREFGRMFEATWLINNVLPMDFQPKPEPLRNYFLARLFTEKSDYMSEGGMEGSAGVYSRGKKALMVPLSSLGVKMVGNRVSLEQGSDQSNATLIHEITHQMMNYWLNKLPTWYVEGSADYVSLLEYNSNGRFSLIGLNRRLQGYTKRKYSPAAGGEGYGMIDLEELMTIEGDRWAAALADGGPATANYGSACLLTYFFYHIDGKGDAANLIAYLRQVQDAKTKEEKEAAVKAHLLRERSYAQLSEEVKKGLRKEGVDVTFFPPGKNGPVSGAK